MALKKPLVITSGQIEQLQSTDYINAAPIPQFTNGNASSIPIGTVVYMSGNDAVDYVEGALSLAPNTAVTIQLIKTTTETGIVSMTWAEIPV